MSIQSKLATALDDDHRHDCADFRVTCPDGQFSMQFAAGGDPAPVWNIACNPPRGPPEGYEVIDSGRVFVLVHSDATWAGEAREEFDELLATIGGAEASIYRSKTFTTYKGAPQPGKALYSWLRSRLSGVRA